MGAGDWAPIMRIMEYAMVVFVHGQLNEAAVAFVLGIRKRRTPLAAFALGYQQLRSRQIAVRAKR